MASSVARNGTKSLLLLPVLEVVILSYIDPYLLSLGNLLQITQFGAGPTLLSLGEAPVIVGGKDGTGISIGSTTSLSGVIFSLAAMGGAGIPVAIMTSLVAGAAPGVVNSVLVAMAGVLALIATLGTQHVYSSLALYLTGGVPISGFLESFEWLSLRSIFGIPDQMLFVVIPVTILVFVLIYKIKFRRRAYFMRTNLEVVRFTGIYEVRIRMGIYILTGVLTAIGAVINNPWLVTARVDVDTGMEMQAITVAVLGGTGVAGDSGRLGGVLIGVIIVTMMNSGLQIANINSIWQLVVLDLVLIPTIILNHVMNKFVIRVEKNRE